MPTRPHRGLSNATRERVVRAAVALLEADPRRRRTLLAKLPPVFVNTLIEVPVADTQVRGDLRALEKGNGVGLAGLRGPPVALWLEAGSVLGGQGWEGQAFRDGYAEVTGRRLPPPSVVAQAESVVVPPTPPQSFRLPRRSLLDFVLFTAVCYGVSWLIERLLAA